MGRVVEGEREPCRQVMTREKCFLPTERPIWHTIKKSAALLSYWESTAGHALGTWPISNECWYILQKTPRLRTERKHLVRDSNAEVKPLSPLPLNLPMTRLPNPISWWKDSINFHHPPLKP
ncbi:hypothetical protein CDAR_72891 [Caerostris darwini]|uniref:Uncharacterized protein n=1 Tax=Caerostris darwini TaxID=1538125 RepID=A0AAV4SY91_9ARAC|nr:hypothetical protein CDAR_72891 [Caerostris darwini]